MLVHPRDCLLEADVKVIPCLDAPRLDVRATRADTPPRSLDGIEVLEALRIPSQELNLLLAHGFAWHLVPKASSMILHEEDAKTSAMGCRHPTPGDIRPEKGTTIIYGRKICVWVRWLLGSRVLVDKNPNKHPKFGLPCFTGYSFLNGFLGSCSF